MTKKRMAKPLAVVTAVALATSMTVPVAWADDEVTASTGSMLEMVEDANGSTGSSGNKGTDTNGDAGIGAGGNTASSSSVTGEGSSEGNSATASAQSTMTSAAAPQTKAAGAIHIGENSYATLTEAFAAAKSGDVITLSEDIHVTGVLDADMVDNDADVTLDLGGHVVYGENGNITIRSKSGSLLIRNGSIEANADTYCTVSSWKSTLTLENVNLKNVKANGNSVKAFEGGHIILRNCISASTNGGGAEAAGGTIDLHDCTFTQSGYVDYCSQLFAASGGTGTVNVYSGTYTSENFGGYIFNSGGSINMYGGQVAVTGDKPALKADDSTTSTPSVIKVSGGSVQGPVAIGNSSTLSVSGGSFTGLSDKNKEEFDKYIAPGNAASMNPDGSFSVVIDEVTAVASIDGRGFATLQDAVDAAQNGQKIVLTNNVNLTDQVSITGFKAIELDLAGYEIRGAANAIVIEVGVKTGGDTSALHLFDSSDAQTGKVVSSKQADKAAICVRTDATMLVENCTLEFPDEVEANVNAMIQTQGDLTVGAGTTIESTEAGITVLGSKGVLTFEEGASVEAKAYAVSGNGSKNVGFEGTTINIKGGSLVSTGTCAIYHPQTGVLNVSGGTITGLGGIQMCSGELNVTGNAKITATGADDRENKGTEDGAIPDGAAISVVDRLGYDSVPVIHIDGGIITSEQGATVATYYWKEGANSEWSNPQAPAEVTAGTFSDDAVVPYVVEGSALLLRDGAFLVDDEESIMENGGAYKVPNPNGAPVYFADYKTAEQYATANGISLGNIVNVNPGKPGTDDPNTPGEKPNAGNTSSKADGEKSALAKTADNGFAVVGAAAGVAALAGAGALAARRRLRD